MAGSEQVEWVAIPRPAATGVDASQPNWLAVLNARALALPYVMAASPTADLATVRPIKRA